MKQNFASFLPDSNLRYTQNHQKYNGLKFYFINESEILQKRFSFFVKTHKWKKCLKIKIQGGDTE